MAQDPHIIIECAENVYLLSKLDTLEYKYQRYLISDKDRNPINFTQHPLLKVWFSTVEIE